MYNLRYNTLNGNTAIFGSTNGTQNWYLGSSSTPWYVISSSNFGPYNSNQNTGTWANIYSSTGTVQSSDARLKTNVNYLTDIEVQAANDLMPLLRTFKYIDSGNNNADARTHTGIIAQSMLQVFVNNGLNPLNYGMNCHDTWIDVSGVSEKINIYNSNVTFDGSWNLCSVSDGSGNNITEVNGIVTYTDSAGNVVNECCGKINDKFSVRYDELFAFMLSAYNNRITNLEDTINGLQTKVNNLLAKA